MSVKLLSEDNRPDWFSYPREFVRLVETGLDRFPPWRILDGASVASRHKALCERYPDRELVPFATRLDCDDLACWERGKLPKVTIIHDFATSGWEQRHEFDNLGDWLRSAIDDFILFET